MRQIFILLTGQDDNIGDVVLRRAMVRAFRPHGHLHLYLRGSSAGFRGSMGVLADDVVYEELNEWRTAAFHFARSGEAWFVDKPGELQLAQNVLLSQLRMAPILALIKLRGGLILRLGIGQRQPNKRLTPWFRLLYRISTVVTWRDTQSFEDFRIGSVAPDWAFFEDTASPDPSEARDLVVVSYRSDIPTLSDDSVRAIARFARHRSADIHVVSQVRRDAPRSRELAERLGGHLVDWPESRSHADQERLLREIYRRSSLVISDRLHVLILGMLEGAAPIALVEYDQAKISRHLDAVGFRGSVVDARNYDEAALVTMLNEQALRRLEVDRVVDSARAAIQEQLDAALS